MSVECNGLYVSVIALALSWSLSFQPYTFSRSCPHKMEVSKALILGHTPILQIGTRYDLYSVPEHRNASIRGCTSLDEFFHWKFYY